MREIIGLLLCTCILFASELDTLLSEYESASELSLKTKDESAGNLIIYTRDDLERMQTYTLKDIIKALRMHQYSENRMAQPDPFNSDPMVYASMPLRIYLNDHELLSSLFGSGTLWFGDMELDFIDHVEIYQGLPSIDVGAEAAMIVIRLYSKTPQHDAGGRAKIALGSYGSSMQNLYYAQQFDNWNYFVYAGGYDDKRDTHVFDSRKLYHDKHKEHFFASLGIGQHRFEIHAMHKKSDDFLGAAVGGAPVEANSKLNYYDLAWNFKSPDDSLHFNAAYSNAQSNRLNEYDKVIVPGTSYTKLEQAYEDKSLTLGVKKEFQLSDNTLLLGAQYRAKWFQVNQLKFNDMAYPLHQSFDNQKIYSLYFQNHYALNDDNLLTLSYMYQDYSVKDMIVNEDATHQIRAGYTYADSALVLKSFFSYQEFMPEPYMMSRSFQGNANLVPMRVGSFVQEFNFDFNRLKANVLLGWTQLEDAVVLSPKGIVNLDKIVHTNLQSVELFYDFLERDKVEWRFSRKQRYVKGGESATEHGMLLRMLNSVDAWDLFNEIIVYDGFATGGGVDYSAGARYHVTKDMTISIKGENLLDKTLSWEYLADASPEAAYIEMPIVERKVWFTVEWLF